MLESDGNVASLRQRGNQDLPRSPMNTWYVVDRRPSSVRFSNLKGSFTFLVLNFIFILFF
jgi:hypothetical protein